MVKLDTKYPADSVEFCPHYGSTDVLVCGTYKLLGNEQDQDGDGTIPAGASTSQQRIGKCLVLKLTQNQYEEDLELLQEIDLPAILDMKWSYGQEALLAIADSEGHVSIRKWNQEHLMREVQTIQCRTKDTLCLSLDWSNRRYSGTSCAIVVSCSDGSLSLLAPQSDGSHGETMSWHAHDYEPWIAAWNYWDVNTVYSGGDDMCLKGWDIRQYPTIPIFTNRRFDAGVTTIQSHPFVEHLIAVGSYDATVRLFDVRKPTRPLLQAEVGGGAWRVKWHPNEERKTDLLVACMHDGYKVLRFGSSFFTESAIGAETGDQPGADVIKRFDEHESLAYGVDWSHAAEEDARSTLVASCSFYDHSLYTWKA